MVMMAGIFVLSSIPSVEMPFFWSADFIVKKGGHMIGYGLLALSYWYGLSRGGREVAPLTWGLAWTLAVLYAMTDEYHQSFVPGRGPRWTDVGIDAAGAALVLYLFSRWHKRKM